MPKVLKILMKFSVQALDKFLTVYINNIADP